MTWPTGNRTRRNPRPASAGPGRAGFTLIELLLVVVIILLASFVAMPSLVRSMRGARLRASLRTTIMVHRYTRSLAVLEQKYAAISFDTEKQTIEVVTVATGGGGDSRFIEDLAQPEEPLQAQVTPDLARSLEEGVRMRDFRFEDGEGIEKDGVYLVRYYPNGMCDGYRLRLVDEKGKEVEVAVERFSGQVEVTDL